MVGLGFVLGCVGIWGINDRRLTIHIHTHKHKHKRLQKFYYDPEVDEADEMETFLMDVAGGKVKKKMADVVFCWVGLGWIVWVENRQIVAFNAIDIPNLSTTNPNTPAIQPTNRCRRSGRAGWGRLPR